MERGLRHGGDSGICSFEPWDPGWCPVSQLPPMHEQDDVSPAGGKSQCLAGGQAHCLARFLFF